MKDLVEKMKNLNSKKKIENIAFFIAILVITIIMINYILDDKKQKENKEEKNTIEAILAEDNEEKNNLEIKLEKILSTIKGVGNVNVFINYSESSSFVPIYDETVTTSSTKEEDNGGGTRDLTETKNEKNVVYEETSGEKKPITQKSISPIIQGAIVTAEGVSDANVKNNIINAVISATGLSIEKIQVFEMNTRR